jgi:putative ATP-dependent endonuclease of the OLD family
MKIQSIAIRNFRRLECVNISIEDEETVFVGPNNSGKTSATAIFRCFLGGKDFKIHDFSVTKIDNINAFGNDGNKDHLPTIELDLWFSINPDSIAFGRAFTLLPKLSDEFDQVGVRLKYEAHDPVKMHADYAASYPEADDGTRKRTLSQFLGTDGNLRKYFEISYYSLDSTDNEISETFLEIKDGKAMLQELVRIDFVDAQRNVDDDEGSRSSRLSTAFATFYKKNLEQAEAAEAAHLVIDENNQKLTEHYEKHFSGLMKVIRSLGVPSINDRNLKIVSSLSPDMALQGNTELLYIDSSRKHELPEAYNGLGFKNLIYMAIQISHFHLQWMRTEKNRPLCQLIFIEEPEVHLHAQVQQTFITNIWKIISNAAKETGDEKLVPQFLVTTHSSHILDAVDFSKVRHFQRCVLEGEDRNTVTTLNASKVQSLREFKPESVQIDGKEIKQEEVLKFLKRYLKLTHCDLFFADAAILVEGTVEKLLLPKMVEKSTPNLCTKYLSILEVGGAYAYRFSGLLKFLNIPYLVITDLDSVEAAGKHPVCRGDTPDALTSNASLKAFFGVTSVKELHALKPDQKMNVDQNRCVAFQTDIQVSDGDNQYQMIPRTIEEAFAFDNFRLLRGGQLDLGTTISENLADAYEDVYQRVKSSSFKKTEFALDALSATEEWVTPTYITEGLKWLEARLACDSKEMIQIEN